MLAFLLVLMAFVLMLAFVFVFVLLAFVLVLVLHGAGAIPPEVGKLRRLQKFNAGHNIGLSG